MKELFAILATMGYENIQTYIQSGNVVFQSRKTINKKSAGEISRHILAEKGFEPKVWLLSPEQMQDAIKNNPFATDDGKALHFFFLESQPRRPDIEKLMLIKVASEEFKLNKKVFYLYTPDGVGRSKLAATVEKAMGVPVTARNWNTVRKLMSMAETL